MSTESTKDEQKDTHKIHTNTVSKNMELDTPDESEKAQFSSRLPSSLQKHFEERRKTLLEQHPDIMVN